MAFTASQGKIKGTPKPNEQAPSPGKTKQNKTENPPFIGKQDFIEIIEIQVFLPYFYAF